MSPASSSSTSRRSSPERRTASTTRSVSSSRRTDPIPRSTRHRPDRSRHHQNHEVAMRTLPLTFAAAWLVVSASQQSALAEESDPRLKEVFYDPQAVVTVPVKRGVVTHVVLDLGEAITDVGSGLGAD